jgi:hypothetical protein
MTAPPPGTTQQFSSANFVSLRFHYRNEKFSAYCKNTVI